jgi:signal transduction histidine kinase
MDMSQGWQNGITYIAACGGGWLTGYVVRTRHFYITGLEERAATAERERDHLTRIAVAEERATIARELHDVVAHSLAVMIVQADGADYALRTDPESARSAIRQVASTGREALDDMRRLVGVLRGGADQDPDGSLADVPCPRRPVGLADLDALVERAESARIDVDLRTIGIRRPLPSAVELTLYRIVQEALTNVLRHAGPGTSVRLVLQYGIDSVAVTVTDNGHGKAAAFGSGGHGLIGMRERVAVLGGWFTAGPATGGGWRVDARVPVMRSAAAAELAA